MTSFPLNRRNFLSTVALSALSASAHAGFERRPPNILLFVADDLGYHDRVVMVMRDHTPHLDKLAAEGSATQFYVTFHLRSLRNSCSPGLSSAERYL